MSACSRRIISATRPRPLQPHPNAPFERPLLYDDGCNDGHVALPRAHAEPHAPRAVDTRRTTPPALWEIARDQCARFTCIQLNKHHAYRRRCSESMTWELLAELRRGLAVGASRSCGRGCSVCVVCCVRGACDLVCVLCIWAHNRDGKEIYIEIRDWKRADKSFGRRRRSEGKGRAPSWSRSRFAGLQWRALRWVSAARLPLPSP